MGINYKIEKLIEFSESDPVITSSSPIELSDVKRAFESNTQRLYSFSGLLRAAVLFNTIMQNLAAKAKYETIGSENANAANDEQKRAMESRYQQLMNEFRCNPGNPDKDAGRKYDADLLAATIDSLEMGGAGFEAMLSAVIVNSWTIFESLAGDLWISLLNARSYLAFVAMDAQPDDTDDPDEAERKAKVKFNFSAWDLSKSGLNLNNRMGTLLKDKWDFSRREKAKEAYRKIFRDSQDRDIVSSVFDEKRLRWLNGLRNVLVHNAGVCDGEFVRTVKNHPTLCKIKEGERIQLDCELVCDLAASAIEQGKALFAFVSDWLTAHT